MEARRQKKKVKPLVDEQEDQTENQENKSDNEVRDLISQYEEAGAGISKPRVLLNDLNQD